MLEWLGLERAEQFDATAFELVAVNAGRGTARRRSAHPDGGSSSATATVSGRRAAVTTSASVRAVTSS